MPLTIKEFNMTTSDLNKTRLAGISKEINNLFAEYE
jgi:hypothetical protein